MSVAKNTNKHGVLLAIDSSYGAGAALSASTDGFHVHEEPVLTPAYQFDGARDGKAAGAAGPQRRDIKAGRSITTTLAHRVRLAGSAYSSSTKPTVDRVLRAHGMSATLVTTGGIEKVTYAPFSDGSWESLVGAVYSGGEVQNFKGAYVKKWTHTAKGLGVPIWSFDLFGISSSLPSDSTVPSITYPYSATGGHIRAAASVLTLTTGGGAFQGKVRESTFTSERMLSERLSQADASGNHAGAQLGTFMHTLDCVVEATALATTPFTTTTTIDPYSLADQATALTATLGFNQGTQYSRYKFVSSAAAQVSDVQKDKDGAIVLYHLTVQYNPTSEVADDGLSVVFD